MSLWKTWYALEEATEKSGVTKEQVLSWVADAAICVRRISMAFVR